MLQEEHKKHLSGHFDDYVGQAVADLLGQLARSEDDGEPEEDDDA